MVLLGGMFAIWGLCKLYEGTAEFLAIYYLSYFLGYLWWLVTSMSENFSISVLNDGVLTKNKLRRKSLQLDKIIKNSVFSGKDQTFYFRRKA